MKIARVEREAIAALIGPLDTAERREAYRTGDFPRADIVKDLDRRYRWDLFYEVRAWRVLNRDGITDAHIDTALRQIIEPLSGDDTRQEAKVNQING